MTVADSGTGLDGNVREHIFEPFYTTKSEGLGLGLSISKKILFANGGRIWAINNPEGGATFHFTLPIYGSHTNGNPPNRSPRHAAELGCQ